jgi:hypothetical protein
VTAQPLAPVIPSSAFPAACQAGRGPAAAAGPPGAVSPAGRGVRDRPHRLLRPNPARKVDKPRRLPSTRRAVADTRLAEINQVAATTGDDPELDALILRLDTETACRRGGALALRPDDLDRDQAPGPRSGAPAEGDGAPRGQGASRSGHTRVTASAAQRRSQGFQRGPECARPHAQRRTTERGHGPSVASQRAGQPRYAARPTQLAAPSGRSRRSGRRDDLGLLEVHSRRPESSSRTVRCFTRTRTVLNSRSAPSWAAFDDQKERSRTTTR